MDTCQRAGVTLGAFDAKILAWLANYEPETCAVVTGLITRANTAGLATPRTVWAWNAKRLRPKYQ